MCRSEPTNEIVTALLQQSIGLGATALLREALAQAAFDAGEATRCGKSRAARQRLPQLALRRGVLAAAHQHLRVAADGRQRVRVPVGEHAALNRAGALEPLARGVDVLMLDDVLNRLGAIDERQVQVVEMRLFSGLSVEETATALDVSPRTVKSDWQMARAWLSRELSAGA